MDLTIKAFGFIIKCQTTPLGSQVGMIVRTKENIVFAVFMGYSTKETTHN